MILASKSPRRQELLKYITNNFKVMSADADESLPEGITPEKAVLHLSKIKALPFMDSGETVIGADTVVSADGVILGKPKDEKDAEKMLSFLSGRTHSVFTGVTVINGEKHESFCCETKVTFYKLSENDIKSYLKTGEYKDKAGAYGIQGYGSLLVEKIDGDYFNVVGLPVSRLSRILSRF